MSIQNSIRAIEQVQPHILAFQPQPPHGECNPDAPANNHETSTRYMIIDPILRSLGWDLSDPKDCVVEYRVMTGSQSAVDYALLDDRGKPIILVEAKRIDEHTEEEENWEQVYGYMRAVETARVIVVTTGQYWAIETRNERGGTRSQPSGWKKESDMPLGLHWRDTKGTAERLHRHLARSKLRE